MSKLILFFLLTMFSSILVSEKQIAITIDDLPVAYPGHLDRETQINFTRNIMNTLDVFKVQALGFVIGGNYTGFRKRLLIEFFKRGHNIGNHTFSHPDLNSVSCSLYIEDIISCQRVIECFNEDNMYFRYPYLHRGNTEEKRDSIYQFLHDSNFSIVPVSIYCEDWLFNKNYLNALAADEDSLAEEIGSLYVEHMKDRISYYDSLSNIKHKREIRHILLIHMNFINSIYLDNILFWLKENKWNFIAIEKALEDSVYLVDYISNDKEDVINTGVMRKRDVTKDAI